MKPPMPVRDPADAATSSSAEREGSKSEPKSGSKSEPKSVSKSPSKSASGSKSGSVSKSGDKTDNHTGERSEADRTANFGRFRLLGRIGEGGMAEVYRAVMTGPEGFERELVLKRILPRLSETGDFKTMFIREAKISALLLHPNIVQIYEFGEADGAYFIAMESVQGVTLREALNTLRKDQRAMPHMVAADVTRQICVGLDYAHALHGPDGVALEIVHQDISPTNIMLAYNGTVKILDFGIARAASFAEEEAKKGLIKGKVSYLSPEQINVRPFDMRADVFALGVVFHEMLTGRRLFQAKNDIGRMRQLLASPIPPPSALNAAIPRELDRIVMRALELDPNTRYQTAGDMGADLERTLIAARFSSRELSKLLHELFMPAEAPIVVVDAEEEAKTIAVTATQSSASVSAAGPQPMRRYDSDVEKLGRAVKAEGARMRRQRWRAPMKYALLAAVLGALAGGIVLGARHYWPKWFPPAPPPAVTPNQIMPAPPPEPADPVPVAKPKKRTKRSKARPTEAPETPETAPAPAEPAP
jgi:serine/threonine protein kinase